MPLRFTNSLRNRTETFEPLKPGKASIYCCGVTVYDLCHLGHARSYINWDVLRRYLIWKDYEVTFVQNYTDIDDKILNKAAAEGSTMEEVSERNIEAFEVDMARLNILPADRMPRATRCIDGIQTLISELENKGAAYSSSGDVYFDISKANNYGQLSGRDPTTSSKVPVGAPTIRKTIANAILSTLPSGKKRKMVSQAGIPPGVPADLDGISNAQPWCARNSDRRLTSIWVVVTWSFPTTKTRSLNPKQPMESR